MTYDVVALGELLIDFTSEGDSARANPIFEANPGGAPGNVLAMLAKLGKNTAFIGKVGGDMFGSQITRALACCGIHTGGVLKDEHANTALAFISNLPDGEREFTFIRDGSADTQLDIADLDIEMLESCRIFHFGSLSLTHQPARSATAFALERAKNAGAMISFDPNLRERLWESLDFAREQIRWGCSQCDAMKVADDELHFITGENDFARAVQKIRTDFPQIKLLAITRGASGALAFWGEVSRSRTAFLSDKTIDTTGAGDIFWGAMLAHVLESGLGSPSERKLDEMLAFSCAAATLVTEKRGALLCAPERGEIEQLLHMYASKGT